ncbi:MAG: Pentachlorophenol 4-monooxygenase, partial [Pseudomonadota bacterium]
DTYDTDRVYAADENIRNSTRSTDFITPKSHASRVFRSAVLQLAQHHPFARKLVNSGRLSVPSFLLHSTLNTPDTAPFQGRMVPGAPVDDAPLVRDGQPTWLLDQLGQGFQLLVFTPDAPLWLTEPGHAASVAVLAQAPIPVQVCPISTQASGAGWCDAAGLAAQRFDAQPGTCVLVRPDQHVAARWRVFDEQAVQAAVSRATAQPLEAA